MKPFIYNFLENTKSDFPEVMPLIEYSKTLNLSVLKGSNMPAINHDALSTITFTKAENDDETTDSDQNSFQSMGTMTVTRAQVEGTDSDYSRSINLSLGTQTLTLTGGEGIDSDANNGLAMMLSTRTLTESREDTDSDINR